METGCIVKNGRVYECNFRTFKGLWGSVFTLYQFLSLAQLNRLHSNLQKMKKQKKREPFDLPSKWLV